MKSLFIKIPIMANERIKLVFACLLICMPLLVLLTWICISFYLLSMVDVFQNYTDICWVEDHTKRFITINGRMPESWEELRTYEFYPDDNIESRIEINFGLMKGINAGIPTLLPSEFDDTRKDVWVYRFYRSPKGINQERVMADFFYWLCISKCGCSSVVPLPQNVDSNVPTDQD